MTITYDAVRDFLYREARYLDDRQWDEWLELYAQDATFWMPSWDDNDELTEDCLLYTSPSPRDRTRSRMPSSA